MSRLQLFIPDFCIIQTYNEFSKWRYGARIVGENISKRRYEQVRRLFHEDTLNGKVIQPYDLSRHHVIAADLISAVDYHYQYFRASGEKSGKRFTSIDVIDTLLGAMGIWLVKMHGRENVAVVTADNRMEAIIGKAQRVSKSALKELGLMKNAANIGLEYSPHIFPNVLHLEDDSVRKIKEFFGRWPLPVRQTRLKFGG
jgi:hypothetical protein